METCENLKMWISENENLQKYKYVNCINMWKCVKTWLQKRSLKSVLQKIIFLTHFDCLIDFYDTR